MHRVMTRSLDISVDCDETLLKKYSLEANAAILASDEHLALLDEIKQFEGVLYCAGGATQNAIRGFSTPTI